MGFTQTWAQAVGCRVVLAFAEAPFYPAAMLLASKLYTRREVALRVSLLYIGELGASAFVGLLAAAVLDNLDGFGGHAAWRYLCAPSASTQLTLRFWLTGSATVLLGCAVFLLVPERDSCGSRGGCADR